MLFTPGVLGKDCKSLGQLQWLLGDWHTQNDHRRVSERWQQVSGLTFEGTGETFSDKGHSVEYLYLTLMGDGVFYLAKVAENPMPVPFRMTGCSGAFAQFENPGHDFPQRIAYRLLSSGQLSVRVEDLNGQGFDLTFDPDRSKEVD
ncbi:hypothetical protein GCM10027098_38970 [Bowmanella dokdonensis]